MTLRDVALYTHAILTNSPKGKAQLEGMTVLVYPRESIQLIVSMLAEALNDQSQRSEEQTKPADSQTTSGDRSSG